MIALWDENHETKRKRLPRIYFCLLFCCLCSTKMDLLDSLAVFSVCCLCSECVCTMSTKPFVSHTVQPLSRILHCSWHWCRLLANEMRPGKQFPHFGVLSLWYSLRLASL